MSQTMPFNYIVEDAFKSTDEVINRIFNHKPFLEAEIRSMVRDFEEEPNKNGEIDQILDGAFERVRDVKDNQIDCFRDYCENKFPSLEDRVDKIENLMKRVLSTEQTKESERKVKMDQFITKQNEGLVQFMQQMEQRINDIDSSYERAREQVYQKYNKTENKS